MRLMQSRIDEALEEVEMEESRESENSGYERLCEYGCCPCFSRKT